jgi:CRP-like cAMP-binding protein
MLQGKFSLDHKKLIFKEGENASKLYMIKSGEVICLKQSKDRLVPIFTARENDIIGENAMVAGSLYSYSAITNSFVELIEIPASHFTTVFREAPEWLVELTTTMIGRFQHTASLIAENRIIHSSLVEEDKFTSAFEVECKKLLT